MHSIRNLIIVLKYSYRRRVCYNARFMRVFIISPLSAWRHVVCPINCPNTSPLLTLSPFHKKPSRSGTMKEKILTPPKGIEKWLFSSLDFRIIITC